MRSCPYVRVGLRRAEVAGSWLAGLPIVGPSSGRSRPRRVAAWFSSLCEKPFIRQTNRRVDTGMKRVLGYLLSSLVRAANPSKLPLDVAGKWILPGFIGLCDPADASVDQNKSKTN